MWCQPCGTHLGWTVLSKISSRPHQWSYGRIGANSCSNVPKSCGKSSQKCYSSILKPLILKWHIWVSTYFWSHLYMILDILHNEKKYIPIQNASFISIILPSMRPFPHFLLYCFWYRAVYSSSGETSFKNSAAPDEQEKNELLLTWQERDKKVCRENGWFKLHRQAGLLIWRQRLLFFFLRRVPT